MRLSYPPLVLSLAVCGLWIAEVSAAPPAAGNQVDQYLAQENAGLGVESTPVVDDLAFLRRIYVDLIGRIPSEAEIQSYMKLPAQTRRSEIVDVLMEDERFAERWTVFFGDMMRIRYNRDGGRQLAGFVYQSIRDNRPYDEMCHQMISANGKAGKAPAVGYILGDDADPMALAGVTAQVFMGVRIACAQCHDHPFDVWTREQFYGFAAYFGRTQRVESELTRSVYTTEMAKNSILWPPEDAVNDPSERKPMVPAFPFAVDKQDRSSKPVARLIALRTQTEVGEDPATKEPSVDDLLADAGDKVKKTTSGTLPDSFDVAGEAKREAKGLNVANDLYRASELRSMLADRVTDPKNRYFSRSFVNRVWAELIGRGFVEPLDDFSDGNDPSHPQTLDYLADEFVASGFDFRNLVKMVVTSDAYRRSHLYGVPEDQRLDAELAFAAAPLRRMISETLYDSIVQAGHLFDVKHPAGQNLKTDWRYARVAKRPERTQVASITPAQPKPAMKPKVEVESTKPDYSLEDAIEIDFETVLTGDADLKIEMMDKMTNDELEMQQEMARRNTLFVDEYVRSTYDDNPKFSTSLRMASPAPRDHFLRVFGQPGRESLGDFRDDASSMRQALMMLNGRLTNEAARVGELEAMHALLVGEKANLNEAIRLAYREILTREPAAGEMADAREIIEAGDSTVAGMADLRWVLLNCHEFRFLP